jgi:hypothetical protein
MIPRGQQSPSPPSLPYAARSVQKIKCQILGALIVSVHTLLAFRARLECVSRYMSGVAYLGFALSFFVWSRIGTGGQTTFGCLWRLTVDPQHTVVTRIEIN